MLAPAAAMVVARAATTVGGLPINNKKAPSANMNFAILPICNAPTEKSQLRHIESYRATNVA
jgi:hypothetical protein